MANILSNAGIVDGQIIYADQITQFYEAFTGNDAYDITISGSFVTEGPFLWTGSIDAGGQDVKFVVSNDSGVLYVTASSFLTASLTQTLTSNQNVGGITSGDSFAAGSSIEALLRTMLISYIEPTISNLAIKLNNTAIGTEVRDVGNSFTCNTASFNATVDSPDGNYPVSASITASGADIGTQQIFLSNTLAASNTFKLGSVLTINKASSAGNVSFAVNTKSQTTADTQTVNTTFSFNWRNYLAASSTVVIDNSTAQTVVSSGTVDSILTTTKAWTATCDANNNDTNKFTYIIYPATYGDLTSVIQNGSLPVSSSFTKKGDFTIANAYGSSNSFRVYQSNQPGAFAAGTTLTIS